MNLQPRRSEHRRKSAAAPCMSRAAVLWLALGCALAPLVSAQESASTCGGLSNGYGPFDYRTDRDKLPIVENSHFQPSVEGLVPGSDAGSNLDYTLRAFPNHHRAVLAMQRWSERTKNSQPPGARFTIGCYFERGVRFRPDDTTMRMLYATYLRKNGREADARGQLEAAVSRAGDNGFTHYNAGLLYLEMKQYDKALTQAHRAISLGFTRSELPDLLKKAGHWREVPAGVAQGASGAALAASATSPATQ